MTSPDRRSSTTARVRAVLVDLMGWHILSQTATTDIMALRERVVLLTGRVDLDELDPRDISLRAKLIEAVEDYQEGE